MSKQVVSVKNCTCNYCTCCYIEITVHPQSINTTLNSTINFTCETVDLQINNMSDVNNRGCIYTSEDNFNGTKRQVLLDIAFKDKYNTNISCRVINDSDAVDSDIVLLRIQGELMF